MRGIAQAPRTVLAVLMLIGFTAVTAQIVLMRELMVVFCGNEMSLGLILASWLLWTAIGSSALGRMASRTDQPRQLMALLEVLVALVLPLAIFLARASKGPFQSVPGEILGPGPMILTSLVVLSAFCLLSGGLFAVGSWLFAQEAGTSTLAGTSNVYLLEALGSGLGGILASLLLIRYFTSFQIAALLCLLNFLGAASLAIPSVPRRRAAGLALVVIGAILSRALRGKTDGFVVTPTSVTRYDEAMQIAATVALAPHHQAEPAAPQRESGGGGFGGAGASGEF